MALKENTGFRKMVTEKISRAELRDYESLKKVVLEWDLNQDAVRDRMFRITIGKETAVLDYEQFLHYSRLI